MLLKDLFEDVGNRENRNLHQTPPAGNLGELVTTSQAARILGVTSSRVRQLIMDNRLKFVKSPTKGQRDNLLKISEVRKLKKELNNHKPGRKSKDD